MAIQRICTTVSLLAFCCAIASRPVGLSQDAQPPPPVEARHAVIIVGLAGDAEHRVRFHEIELAWTKWLRDTLLVSEQNLLVLSSHVTDAAAEDQQEAIPRPQSPKATSESIRTQINALNQRLHADDALWVFFLGHANYDDEHAFFHLPGPDINEDDVAELFAGTKCREQVFWLTHACSGWYMKSLARPGRIVITATAADREYNETEFPAALTTALNTAADKLDRNADHKVSIVELFVMTTDAVEARFATDQLAPTEHAQLDDNGDGFGTESDKLAKTEAPPANEPEIPITGRVKPPDGRFAATVFLPDAPVVEMVAEPTEDRPPPQDSQDLPN